LSDIKSVYLVQVTVPCDMAIVTPAREVVLLEREHREPSQTRTKVG